MEFRKKARRPVNTDAQRLQAGVDRLRDIRPAEGPACREVLGLGGPSDDWAILAAVHQRIHAANREGTEEAAREAEVAVWAAACLIRIRKWG